MNKAGYLDELASAVDLVSPPEILAETGFGRLKIEAASGGEDVGTNDHKLIQCALAHRLPVISEDRKILMTMDREGIPYFNALMMLNFLLFNKRIGKKDHSLYFDRLKKQARYSSQILEFGKKVYDTIGA